MVKIELHTSDAQLDLEDKILELPESPLVGDFIYFENLFNLDEIETATYEASKQGCRLSGKITERTWYLDSHSLEYKLLLTLDLEKN